MNVSLRLPNAGHTKHPITRAIVFCVLLVLPSCHIPMLKQAEPGPGVPPGFNGATSSSNSSQLGIDQFYTDPILQGLIHQALAGNRELKALEQEVQIAGNEVLARSGAYLPFVTVGGSASAERSSRYTRNGAVETELASPIHSQILPGKSFPDPLPDFRLGLDFIWTPDIFRALRNARDAAAQRYLAACERRNFFVTRLIADTAENYYNLLALDKRLEILDRTIVLQEDVLGKAKARMDAGRSTQLPVQRFQADVRKNQSEKLIVRQEIVEVENRINVLVNRYPQTVERMSAVGFFDMNIHALDLGVPAQLLQNRPDIRQAERELVAAGLDVKVARASFFPAGTITAGVGYEAFDPKYLFYPEAIAANAAGQLVAPLINKKAIKANYLSANARQLESVYNYQRVILNAFTEVINRVSMVENYRRSIEIKKQQLQSLDAAVETANSLFQFARIEYIEVLLVLRDLLEARTVLIDTKRQQLVAVVNAYQALGGGDPHRFQNADGHLPAPQGIPLPTLPAPAASKPDAKPPVPLPKLPAAEVIGRLPQPKAPEAIPTDVSGAILPPIGGNGNAADEGRNGSRLPPPRTTPATGTNQGGG